VRHYVEFAGGRAANRDILSPRKFHHDNFFMPPSQIASIEQSR
jgi:hypothetical protein